MLSGAACSKDLYNPVLEVAMCPTQMQKRFPSWAGEKPPI